MYKKVLVPLDGSKLAECVVDHVKSIISGYMPDGWQLNLELNLRKNQTCPSVVGVPATGRSLGIIEMSQNINFFGGYFTTSLPQQC